MYDNDLHRGLAKEYLLQQDGHQYKNQEVAIAFLPHADDMLKSFVLPGKLLNRVMGLDEKNFLVELLQLPPVD